MTRDPLGYYKILDVLPCADAAAIKNNYREKAKIWHPDHNDSQQALENFQKVALAYDVLKNPKSKIIYGLLSLVYETQNFPDMKTLKIYKAVDGEETPFLRVFKLYKILPGFKKSLPAEENLIGTWNDALSFIQKITRHNWLQGMCNPFSFKTAFKALKSNYQNINANFEDNFKLLIHNAAAYYAAENLSKARLSAVQALDYAPAKYRSILVGFINGIAAQPENIPAWDYDALKKIQLRIPFLLSGAVLLLLIMILLPLAKPFFSAPDSSKIAYYQEVRFNSGAETVDDVVVAKIFNIPVDTADTSMLYYTIAPAKIMYGPSEEFDVLGTARLRQTVRVTGYTPEQDWFRVMLDNGEMGFIKKQYLKKGIGRDIPENSKIFYNPDL